MLFMIVGFNDFRIITCTAIDGKPALFSRAEIAAELEEARALVPDLSWRAVGHTGAEHRAYVASEAGLI